MSAKYSLSFDQTHVIKNPSMNILKIRLQLDFRLKSTEVPQRNKKERSFVLCQANQEGK